MSTMRLSVGLLILLPFLGLAGCASTSGIRGPAASRTQMRTVASVGDRPLPVVTGEPGDLMSADRGKGSGTADREGASTSASEPESEPASEPAREARSKSAGTGLLRRADGDGRISGRVVDDRGEPVDGARVRLAVSSAPGGRLVRATTDRGGGFTLRGLRPGTSYTLIAEWEDAQGVLTGRSKVQAPDTNVVIALGGDENESGPGSGSDSDSEVAARDEEEQVSSESGVARSVSPVSRRDRSVSRDAIDSATEDEPRGPRVVGTPINVEDLPPAPEADELAIPATRPRSRVSRAQGRALDPEAIDESDRLSASPSSSQRTWRRGESSPAASSVDEAGADARAQPSASSIDRLDPAGSRGPGAIEAEDDDGPNPLPPAIEQDQVSHASPTRTSTPTGRRRPAAPAAEAEVLRTATRQEQDESPAAPKPAPGALVASTSERAAPRPEAATDALPHRSRRRHRPLCPNRAHRLPRRDRPRELASRIIASTSTSTSTSRICRAASALGRSLRRAFPAASRRGSRDWNRPRGAGLARAAPSRRAARLLPV